MGKIAALWALFRRGNEVANPEAWKTGQVSINAVAGLLVAVVSVSDAFGFRIPITDDQLVAVAGGVFAAVNVVLTVITSARIGLPAKPAPVGEPAPGGAIPSAPTEPAASSEVDYRG